MTNSVLPLRSDCYADLNYQLLNAKPENVERESEIVGQSGRKGAITIATNMAGRGTDIILGGNPEYMARYSLYLSVKSCTHNALEHFEQFLVW